MKKELRVFKEVVRFVSLQDLTTFINEKYNKSINIPNALTLDNNIVIQIYAVGQTDKKLLKKFTESDELNREILENLMIEMAHQKCIENGKYIIDISW